MHKLFSFFAFITIFCSCSPSPIDPPAQINLQLRPDVPEIFGEGLISTLMNERDLAISPDQNRIVYTLGNHNSTYRVLVELKRKNEGEWEKGEILPFSGRYNDIEPFFHPAKFELYFCSDRPVPGDSSRSDYNIWSVQFDEEEWYDPEPLSKLINTTEDEFFPSVSENGNLYFTATKTTGLGKEDIYLSILSDGIYSEPVVLDSAINSSTYEFNAYISPDERTLIFSSWGREDDLGGGDLYISHKNQSNQWSKAKHLPAPINSEKLDFCPFINYKNQNFYFTSQRTSNNTKNPPNFSELTQHLSQPGNGMGDIYVVDLEKINY